MLAGLKGRKEAGVLGIVGEEDKFRLGQTGAWVFTCIEKGHCLRVLSRKEIESDLHFKRHYSCCCVENKLQMN